MDYTLCMMSRKSIRFVSQLPLEYWFVLRTQTDMLVSWFEQWKIWWVDRRLGIPSSILDYDMRCLV